MESSAEKCSEHWKFEYKSSGLLDIRVGFRDLGFRDLGFSV